MVANNQNLPFAFSEFMLQYARFSLASHSIGFILQSRQVIE